MTDIAGNLAQGLRLGYGIGSDLADRGRANTKRTALSDAYKQGGDFATYGDFDNYRKATLKAYADAGDVEGGNKAYEQIGNQVKAKFTDGLNTIRGLVASGDPNAMQQATQMMPKVWGYLPTGTTINAAYNPQDNKIYMHGVDEKTGQPSSTGKALDPEYFDKIASIYGETVAQMHADELGKATQEEATRAHKADEAQAGINAGTLKSYYEATVANQRAGIGVDQQRLTEQATHDRAAEKLSGDTLAENQRQFNEGGDQRTANVQKTLMDTDVSLATLYKDKPWDAGADRGYSTVVGQTVDAMSNAALGDASKMGIDPLLLKSSAMEVLRLYKPGERSAFSTVMSLQDLAKNPANWGHQIKPENPSVVLMTNTKTGEQFFVPATTFAQITGGRPQAAATASPTPGS